MQEIVGKPYEMPYGQSMYCFCRERHAEHWLLRKIMPSEAAGARLENEHNRNEDIRNILRSGEDLERRLRDKDA